MTEGLIVLGVALSMFLVMAVGWVARRFNYLSDEATQTLGRLIIDITFPALVFTQMINTVDRASLHQGFALLWMGALVLLLSALVGWGMSRVLGNGIELRRTFVFLVAIPNWIFLPLPVAEALFGQAGVRAVLLFNISAQIVLWTVGVGILKGGERGIRAFRNLILNPGLLATVAGVWVALYWPQAKDWSQNFSTADAFTPAAAKIFFKAISMMGSLTVPLSLVVTGAQLGALKFSEHRPDRNVALVMLARLVIAPLAVAAFLILLKKAGLSVDPMTERISCLIAAMPVAVSCGVFVERYGGDLELGSRAVCYSTLVSIVTIPLLFYLTQKLSLL